MYSFDVVVATYMPHREFDNRPLVQVFIEFQISFRDFQQLGFITSSDKDFKEKEEVVIEFWNRTISKFQQ